MGTELPETRPLHEGDFGVDLEAGAFVGEYEIEKQLGRGSMGTVYAAINPTIERRVAIKILRRDLCKDEGSVGNFVREARAANKIRHTSIAEVFGCGQTEDGRCYLIMELLEGESLAARLAYDRPSLSQSCRILTEIARALEAAHQAGIVHGDIVPGNVFLLDNDRVKLLDFGLARLVDHCDAVDARTDVYALGIVAYDLLVGQPPFTVDPAPPTSLAPGLPATADVLLLEMLAKDPEQRPPLSRVRELLHAIRVPNRKPAPRAVPVEPPPPPAARRRFPVALAATVVVMIGCYATWRVASGEDADVVVAPASIIEPAEAPLESPIEMPTLRSAEKAKYRVVEKPVRVEVERPRPAAAPLRPVVRTAPPVIARPAPPPVKKVEPVGETPAVLVTPPTINTSESKRGEPAAEPPIEDLDALKRPTFKRDRPVP